MGSNVQKGFRALSPVSDPVHLGVPFPGPLASFVRRLVFDAVLVAENRELAADFFASAVQRAHSLPAQLQALALHAG